MHAQTAKRDYYEVLGVARDADPKAIKDAFRELALKYHPDRNKEPGAEERFKEIAEAYAVLSDARKRSEYDASGFPGVSGFSPEDLFGGIDFDSIMGDFGFGGGSDLFERLFGRRRRGPARGPDATVEIVVPLDRIASGGEQPLRFSRIARCPACGGSGAKPGTNPHACASCQGSGRRTTRRRESGIFLQRTVVCPDCKGRGNVIDEPCPQCAASGQVLAEESLLVSIPAGAEDGLALRIPGKGNPGERPGEPPGDLFAVVRTAADERFERAGADLWRVQPIDVVDAVLGAEIAVPTLEGTVTVKVPQGTQPDAQLRLRAKGLPRFGARGRGDLYVRLAIRVPDKPSTEERKLWEKLRIARGPGKGMER
jgi:molecular chaperone DnaJ